MKLNLFLLSAAALFNAAQAVAIVGDLGGQVLVPGVYTGGACALNGSLQLDDNGMSNPTWDFQCTGALVTGAAASITFTDKGSPDNVNWEIGAATTAGAGCSMIGNLVSVGAITLGASVEWTGNLTTDAAIGVGAVSTLNGDVTAVGAITIGAGSGYTGSLTSTSGAVTLGAGTVALSSSPTIAPISTPAGSNGDPHFKTWHGEHYEFHGQCDLVLAKDVKFAHGLGLDVQIRTKLVRYWSYIKSAAIRIGDDILEVQGSGDPDDAEMHYWINFQPQGEVSALGGFPLTVKQGTSKSNKHRFEIDLSSKFPGQSIVIVTMKEFVRVDFVNASEEAYANAVGLLGDFKTGKTLARDGATLLHDYLELGIEWQLLPTDDMLFHDTAEPQFPTRCILPEDPRGQRRRRLEESSISEEEAEAACAKALKDAADIKDCVYDVLATQDVAMVGAF